jgi:hypothetical protein
MTLQEERRLLEVIERDRRIQEEFTRSRLENNKMFASLAKGAAINPFFGKRAACELSTSLSASPADAPAGMLSDAVIFDTSLEQKSD